MTDTPEVTGRDAYVIAQALYEFIRLEQSKPTAERRGSDERDAKAIRQRLAGAKHRQESCLVSIGG
jgi:hypothetical protein